MSTVLEEVKKVWSRYPILEITNYTHDNNKPLKRFIEDVFLHYNEDVRKTTVTRKRKIPVSHYRARRSFVDMWGLCRNYYKDCSLEDVCKAMFDLVKEEKIYGNWFCETVNRYVFSPYKNEYENTNIRDSKLLLNNKEIRISNLAQELGYKMSDFDRKVSAPNRASSKTFLGRRSSLVSTSTFYWG